MLACISNTKTYNHDDGKSYIYLIDMDERSYAYSDTYGIFLRVATNHICN